MTRHSEFSFVKLTYLSNWPIYLTRCESKKIILEKIQQIKLNWSLFIYFTIRNNITGLQLLSDVRRLTHIGQ